MWIWFLKVQEVFTINSARQKQQTLPKNVSKIRQENLLYRRKKSFASTWQLFVAGFSTITKKPLLIVSRNKKKGKSFLSLLPHAHIMSKKPLLMGPCLCLDSYNWLDIQKKKKCRTVCFALQSFAKVASFFLLIFTTAESGPAFTILRGVSFALFM